MAEAPLELIEDLASKQAQVRWIVGGTVNEYILPEELLNDGIRFCEIFLASNIPSSLRQRQTVHALKSAIDSAGNFLDRYDRSNISVLVESDVNWIAIRQRATEVMMAFSPLPYE